MKDLRRLHKTVIRNYDIEDKIGYTLMVDVDYPVYLQLLHKDFSFLHERREINGEIKFVCYFYDEKIMYVILDYCNKF